jgi:predicted DsbA family dithiol-disulfide isomerase
VADPVSVSVTFFTDPWCPWSWAAEPARRRLQVEFGDQAAFTYVLGGMAHAIDDPPRFAREWLDAAEWSGMPLDPRGLLSDPPAATHPAALAVKAAAEQGNPAPLLRRLRVAIMLERRRADRADALLDLAREAGGLDLERLRIAFGSNGPVEALGADLDRARAAHRTLPWLEIGGAVVDGRAPYEEWRAAMVAAGAEPAPARPGLEEALRRFGELTTAEVAAACDLPGPRAPAELWRLASEWRVRARPVLGGTLWSPT